MRGRSALLCFAALQSQVAPRVSAQTLRETCTDSKATVPASVAAFVLLSYFFLRVACVEARHAFSLKVQVGRRRRSHRQRLRQSVDAPRKICDAAFARLFSEGRIRPEGSAPPDFALGQRLAACGVVFAFERRRSAWSRRASHRLVFGSAPDRRESRRGASLCLCLCLLSLQGILRALNLRFPSDLRVADGARVSALSHLVAAEVCLGKLDEGASTDPLAQTVSAWAVHRSTSTSQRLAPSETSSSNAFLGRRLETAVLRSLAAKPESCLVRVCQAGLEATLADRRVEQTSRRALPRQPLLRDRCVS